MSDELVISKAEVVASLASACGLSKAAAGRVLQALNVLVGTHLAAGHTVRLGELGAIEPVSRAARAGTRPDGTPYQSAPSQGARLRIGAPLKRALNP